MTQFTFKKNYINKYIQQNKIKKKYVTALSQNIYIYILFTKKKKKKEEEKRKHSYT